MRRMHIALAALTLSVMMFAALPAYAEQPQTKEPSEQAVALTDQQKQELAAIYKTLFDTKKQLIAKYAEFGIIPQEKAIKWAERLDARYAKLEQNGFVPHWDKCKDKKDGKESKRKAED